MSNCQWGADKLITWQHSEFHAYYVQGLLREWVEYHKSVGVST